MPTAWFERDGGSLAYSDEGDGSVVVCVPGLGDLRQEYRFLSPALVEAGFRVVSLDLRGHGESSTGWSDYSAEAIGGDVLALIRHLDAARVIVVGTSMAAGAAVWAAAEDPAAVAGVVLVGPFVRDVGSKAMQGVLRLLFRGLLMRPWGIAFWIRYWTSLFPSRKPDDHADYEAALRRSLAEPGRLAALRAIMLGPSRAGIEGRLAQVKAPALVLMGSKDRDFEDPVAEAQLVADRVGGTIELIEGAGHYPHVEFPDQTAELVVAFAARVRAAAGNGSRQFAAGVAVEPEEVS